jgi:hypothetical protein
MRIVSISILKIQLLALGLIYKFHKFLEQKQVKLQQVLEQVKDLMTENHKWQNQKMLGQEVIMSDLTLGRN